MRRIPARWAVLLLTLAMAAAACNGDDGDNGADGADGAGEGGGQEVSLLHGISGAEEQEALQEAIDAFEEQSGHTVSVEASPNFETVILTRVQGGNPPDVGFYPQPGLLERVSGETMPLEEVGIDADTYRDELVEGMVETATFDDTDYGVVVKASTKSLLWYRPDAFDEAGYEVPETWDDMIELTDTIASDTGDEAGRAPWCVGIEAADATGWVATDWVEDIMLRMHGPDVYDDWVSGDLPFDSPEVRAAYEELEEIWLNEDYVLGGPTGILQTPFGDAAAPMFTDPPNCYLHRQAGFIEASFPEDAELGSGYDVVHLPPMDEGVGNPALTGGDIAAIHTDNPAAAEFVDFLLSSEGQEAWMGHPGAGSLSVRTDFDSSAYPSEALARQGDILANADFARFDASDAMPGQVGAGAFWTETVAWISGSQDLDATLQSIDSAWPDQPDEGR